MSDTFNEPPVARPVQYAPEARPMACASTAAATERSYPDLAMSASAAAIDLVAVVVLTVVGLGALFVSGLPEYLAELWPGIGLLGANIVIGVFNLMMVATMLLLRRQGPRTIGLNNPPAHRLLPAVVVAIPACWAASLVGAILYIVLVGFKSDQMLADKTELFDMVADFPAALILPFSVFVGIHEEVLFRGFFLSRMRALSGSNAAAIIVTAIVFGLLHFYQGLIGIFQTTMIGLFLAIIVTYSRTLWPAIIAHAVFDAANMAVMPWILKMLKELEPALTSASAPG